MRTEDRLKAFAATCRGWGSRKAGEESNMFTSSSSVEEAEEGGGESTYTEWKVDWEADWLT